MTILHYTNFIDSLILYTNQYYATIYYTYFIYYTTLQYAISHHWWTIEWKFCVCLALSNMGGEFTHFKCVNAQVESTSLEFIVLYYGDFIHTVQYTHRTC